MSKDDVWEMAGLLQRDCEKTGEELEKDDTPYRRRTYVRTIFASLEAAIFLMKQTALERPALLTADEIAKCRDEKPPYLSLPKSVEFAVEVFSKTGGSPYRLNKDGKEWPAFLMAIEVRNAITHPKRLGSLNISDEEIEAVGLAYRMVVSSMIHSVAQGQESLRRELNELCEKHGA